MSINDLTSLITAIGFTVTAIGGVRINRRVRTTNVKLTEVHEAVNGNTEKQLQRVDQLAGALTEHGVPVPERQPLTTDPPPTRN